MHSAKKKGYPLSPRERDVADLLMVGLSNKLIAVQLGISEHTAKFHVKAVTDKYGTTSRVVAAVQWALEKERQRVAQQTVLGNPVAALLDAID